MGIGNIQRWTGFVGPSPSMLRLQLEREGFAVSQWIDRLGMVYGWHTHNEDQVHYIISGELEVTVDIAGIYHTYILKAGDRDLVEAKVFHKTRVIGNGDLTYLVGAKRKVEEPKVEEIAPKPKKTRAAKSTTPKTKTTKAKATKTTTTKVRKKK
ncbi:MAG: cupin domain-containing protein [Pyrinomonadaceae bacterium]|nr:cupin domain-containing protein [Pyrinomonadaceae bacterium]